MQTEKPSVYLETSFISMLTGRHSAHVATASMQYFSRLWWDSRRDEFRVFVSDVVYDEIALGNPEAAARRLQVVAGIPVLETTANVRNLARELIWQHSLPAKSISDAGHIACAAVHGVNYLLTWNCKHIANVEMKPRIERLIREAGYAVPTLVTPQLFLGESS